MRLSHVVRDSIRVIFGLILSKTVKPFFMKKMKIVVTSFGQKED